MHPINLPSFKLVRRLTLLASLCGSLFLAAQADGAVLLTVTDTNGSPNSVDVDPNVPSSRFFSVDVFLTFTSLPAGITGVTYLFETPNAVDSSLFQITARNTAGGLFTGANLTTPDGTVLTLANALLDARNNNDLGGTVADPLNECILPGTYFLATYTLEAKPALSAGNHVIQTALVSVTGCEPNFDEFPVAAAGYTVRVVPEPAAGCLLALGCTLLGWARGRRANVTTRLT